MFLAHSDGGALNVWGLVFVVIPMGAAAIWLISINRRLDAQEEQTVETQPRSKVITYLVGGAGVIAIAAMFFAVYRAQSHLNEAQPQIVVTDLCKAASQAKTDPAAALATFNGSPHNALHNLVTAVNAKDAAASARLTRAKTAAEEGLIAKSPDAPEFVATLADQVVKGYLIVDPTVTLTGCA